MRRTPPDIDASRLEPGDDGAALLEYAKQHDIRVEEFHFQSQDFSGLDLTALAVNGCVFEHCRFTGTRLHRATLSDCELNSCELSGCNLSDSRLSRVAFHGCKLNGAVFAEGYLQDLLLADCVALGANFGATRQFSTEIQRGNFTEADFTDCELKAPVFDDVDFSRASFFRTPLRGVSFAGSRIDTLGVELQSRELRGCKMDFTQLAELAALLGIELV